MSEGSPKKTPPAVWGLASLITGFILSAVIHPLIAGFGIALMALGVLLLIYAGLKRWRGR